jgi:hypothetical protein
LPLIKVFSMFSNISCHSFCHFLHTDSFIQGHL